MPRIGELIYNEHESHGLNEYNLKALAYLGKKYYF